MRIYLVLRELNLLQELELCPLGPLELPQRGPHRLVVLPVVVDGVRYDEAQVERGGVYAGGGGLSLPALATRVAPWQLQGIQAQVSAGQQEQEQQGLHRGVFLFFYRPDVVGMIAKLSPGPLLSILLPPPPLSKLQNGTAVVRTERGAASRALLLLLLRSQISTEWKGGGGMRC